MIRLVGAFIAVGLAFLAGPAAFAHPMPDTIVVLDIGQNQVELEAQIPVTDLQLASGLEIEGDPAASSGTGMASVEAYLLDHVRAVSEQGDPWTVVVTSVAVDTAEIEAGTYSEVRAHFELTPPQGQPVSAFRLDYDAVVHQVVTHKILVSMKQSWMNGQLDHGDDGAIALGTITASPVDGSISSLAIDTAGGSYWNGFVAMLQLGMTHIAAGTDHLLFLLVLLIPAPLRATGGGYRGYRGIRSSLVSVVRIVTAFTIGHSATLVLTSLFRLDLPQQPIEILIALTIAIGGLHALRPLFPGREAYVAGLFGLIHGMAFSFTLVELDLTTPQLVLSLLGFNLGIEIIQIAIVLAVMPALLMLARAGVYTPLRIAGGATAVVAAVGWGIARFGVDNQLAALADALGSFAPYLIAILTGLGLLGLLLRRTPT